MSVTGGVPANIVSMDDDNWGERTARVYDRLDAAMFAPDVLTPTVAFLAELAGDGRALEFAAGTGRVTIPLSHAGVDVAGIEMSPAMAAELARKPGADRVPVTIGDMASTQVNGSFRLVYLVYNTITNLLTQEAQVACFANAAAHLEPGGYFVIEVFVPQLRRLPMGETRVAFDVSESHLGVDTYDVVNQTLVSHHSWHGSGHGSIWRSRHRYAWPAEYDLMARLAGLELHERWADWHRNPFTADSPSHVSVWWRPS